MKVTENPRIENGYESLWERYGQVTLCEETRNQHIIGVGYSLRTENIFVGKTSSGFPEDINREDEVTLTSVSCVQPRLNAQIY